MKKSDLRQMIKEELLKEIIYITKLSDLQKVINSTKARPFALEVVAKMGNKEFDIDLAREEEGRFVIYISPI